MVESTTHDNGAAMRTVERLRAVETELEAAQLNALRLAARGYGREDMIRAAVELAGAADAISQVVMGIENVALGEEESGCDPFETE